MYSVLRSGTVRKSMRTVDEKQNISLLWPYNIVVNSSILQFDVEKCHFLVDLDLPVATALEPRYVQDTETWQKISSYPFLDAAR